MSIGSTFDFLVLKHAAHRTSQRVKWTSGASVLIVFWKVRRTDGRTDGRADGGLYGSSYGRSTVGQTVGRTVGRADRRTGGRTDTRTDGRSSGRVDGRADGRAGGRTERRHVVFAWSTLLSLASSCQAFRLELAADDEEDAGMAVLEQATYCASHDSIMS